MSPIISLAPLTLEDHVPNVQQVYHATPNFWAMHGLSDAPDGQAQADLREVDATPNRAMMGVVHRVNEGDPDAGFEMIGIIDFRLFWPQDEYAYLGMLMVAEPFQRQGVGSQVMMMIQPWMANQASIRTIRLGVEQFNTDAVQFFQQMGYKFTRQTSRIGMGEKWIRLLHMEKKLAPIDSAQTET